MKKVITILAIMIVLVGVVFAATGDKETHTIRLKTQVLGDDPVFTLAASYVASATSTTTTSTNSASTAFAKDKAYTDASDIVVADLSKNDISVTFTSKLVNEAKSKSVYTITFQPGPFTVDKLDDNNNRVTGQKVYATNNSDSAMTDTTSSTSTIKGYEMSDWSVTTDADGVLKYSSKITFDGGVSSVGTLATYSVKYAKDPKIAPNNTSNTDTSDDYYYANCKMTVTLN